MKQQHKLRIGMYSSLYSNVHYTKIEEKESRKYQTSRSSLLYTKRVVAVSTKELRKESSIDDTLKSKPFSGMLTISRDIFYPFTNQRIWTVMMCIKIENYFVERVNFRSFLDLLQRILEKCFRTKDQSCNHMNTNSMISELEELVGVLKVIWINYVYFKCIYW